MLRLLVRSIPPQRDWGTGPNSVRQAARDLLQTPQSRCLRRAMAGDLVAGVDDGGGGFVGAEDYEQVAYHGGFVGLREGDYVV